MKSKKFYHTAATPEEFLLAVFASPVQSLMSVTAMRGTGRVRKRNNRQCSISQHSESIRIIHAFSLSREKGGVGCDWSPKSVMNKVKGETASVLGLSTHHSRTTASTSSFCSQANIHGGFWPNVFELLPDYWTSHVVFGVLFQVLAGDFGMGDDKILNSG